MGVVDFFIGFLVLVAPFFLFVLTLPLGSSVVASRSKPSTPINASAIAAGLAKRSAVFKAHALRMAALSAGLASSREGIGLPLLRDSTALSQSSGDAVSLGLSRKGMRFWLIMLYRTSPNEYMSDATDGLVPLMTSGAA